MEADFNPLAAYEGGVLRNRKTYFAILAHINEEALAAQVRNIRHFNPDAGIIVYNGGTDPHYGEQLNILVYPGSHPIHYGNLTPYFWEVMEWLEINGVEYEYLINLDHDVLFIRHGFEDFLDEMMENHDVMGWHMVVSRSPEDTELSCCQDMWKAWDAWGPFFGTDHFIRYLNSTQVYRHGIIRKMLKAVHHKDVEKRIGGSQVFALEEMFFVTLALSLGARIREYPRDENWGSVSRFGHEQIRADEVRLILQNPHYYWIHPVKEAWLIQMNRWLLGLEPWPEPEDVREMDSPSSTVPPPFPLPPAHTPRKAKLPMRKKRTVLRIPRRTRSPGKSGRKGPASSAGKKPAVRKMAARLKKDSVDHIGVIHKRSLPDAGTAKWKAVRKLPYLSLKGLKPGKQSQGRMQ